MTPVGVALPELKWWRNTDDFRDNAYMAGDTVESIWSLRQLSSTISRTLGRRPPGGTRYDTSCNGYWKAPVSCAPAGLSGETTGTSSPTLAAFLCDVIG